MKFATITLVATLLCATHAANYAVIVAGSNGFWNYRHQADVAHAYQLLINNGIPADNIISFAYDDVANDSSNPYKGKLFNKPTDDGVEGVDVYAGFKIDYTGRDVTPENFMAVLTGDKSKVSGGTGRVLESTEEDKVFLNFSDHGGPGLIAFPSKYLYVDDLQKTLDTMTEKKMFSELVFYLEACESGSMFEKL